MSNIRIREVRVSFEEFAYRAPMKFRATVVDRVTILNVAVDGEVGGRITQGFGSMPLGNVWSFPSVRLTFDQTLAAMKQIAVELPPIIEISGINAHPIEINHLLEPMYLRVAAELDLAEPVPPLCTLVVASAFDAAIHDAYGKAHARSAYRTYGSDFMNYDLSHYLDDRFSGEYVDRYISSDPAPSLHLYHLVGALDPLTEGDVTERINDGLPETLEEWVRAEGIDHIKIKLDGDNFDWDVERILSIHRVLQGLRPGADLHYSLDFNERCQSVEYVLECLASIWEAAPAALSQIRYIEQPTQRDLYAPGTPAMYKAAKVKPVVIDESLTDYASLLRARELGYSGVALKACKGQSNALLMAAAAQKFGMFLCVQDLTCPGASLLHSAGLAAHIPPISAIESNARQYVPAANRAWEARFPGIFHVTGGRLDTSHLNGPGLGIVPAVSAQLLGA
jgi:L-alanine-DL-glutamate epimerase-like enolase superfamily enzyme